MLDGLKEAGAGDLPVIVGGIIPDRDAAQLREMGVAAVFTPRDFGLTEIMGGIVDVIRGARGLSVDKTNLGTVPDINGLNMSGSRQEGLFQMSFGVPFAVPF